MMAAVTHSIRLPTPLKCQQKTDHTGNKDGSADSIKLRQLLRPRKFGGVSVRNLETECNDRYGYPTEGEIDIETPSPRYI